MLSSPIQDSPRSFRVETPQDINRNKKFLMKIVQIIVFERVSSDHGISFKWLCSISFLSKANEISSDCYHQSCYSHDALCPFVPSGITLKQHLYYPVSELTQLRLNHRALLASSMVKNMVKWICSKMLSPLLNHLLPLALSFRTSHPGTGEGSWGFWLDVQTKTHVALHQHCHYHGIHCTFSSCHLLLCPRPWALTTHSWPQLLPSTHLPMRHQASGENAVFSRNMLLSSLWWNLTAFHQILQFPLQFYFQACFCFISAMLPTNWLCFHTFKWKKINQMWIYIALSKVKHSRARWIGNLFKWYFNNDFYHQIQHFNLLKFNADFAFYLSYWKSCIFTGY